jgi:hypothetical protein
VKVLGMALDDLFAIGSLAVGGAVLIGVLRNPEGLYRGVTGVLGPQGVGGLVKTLVSGGR